MATKRTIAIIGALEENGQQAVRLLAQNSYRLLLFYKETERHKLVDETSERQYPQLEIEWISCPVDACWEADIIIIAVPAEEQATVATGIKAVVTGKPVIVLNETGTGNDLAERFPYSPVFSVAPGQVKELIQTI